MTMKKKPIDKFKSESSDIVRGFFMNSGLFQPIDNSNLSDVSLVLYVIGWLSAGLIVIYNLYAFMTNLLNSI